MKSLHLLLVLLSFSALNAQISPSEAVEGMGRGINLGNTLEPPFEGNWNNGPAQESYFDAYVEAGFTNVRIPVRWDNHTGNSAPFAVNESWMNRVEEVVDWGLERGLFVTLNGHHEDWLKNNYNNSTLRDRYDAIWEQVAERFKDKSDKLLFEIINEPNGMSVSQVDDLNERILGIIRETNPTRIVIYGGNMYANAEQLFDAKILEDDYIVGYYHAYDPWPFSGQGNGTWGAANDYQQLTNKYNSVKNWSENNDIPIHHSEFGAIHECDFNSRMRIYAHNVEQCISNGFAFSVWDDGGMFGVLNRDNVSWPEVKDILIHYYPDSPNEIFSTIEVDANDQPSVKISWNNRVFGISDIVVERYDSASSSYEEIAVLPSTAEEYVDTEVVIGGTYTYRMFTTRSDGTLLHGYPSRIKVPATVQTPFNTSEIAIPGTLEVEEYDIGGEGLAYKDNEPANIPAGFRVDEGVDIGAVDGQFILEYVVNGEWIEYTVNVEQSGSYSVEAFVASEENNGTFSIEFLDNNASLNFTVPGTGAWYNFQVLNAATEIELEKGIQVMRLNITNNTPFNINRLNFTLETVNSTSDTETSRLFTVSPNPSSGLITVEIASKLASAKNKIAVYTVAGELVDERETHGSTFKIDMEKYGSGIYLLRLRNGKQSMTQKLVIE